MCIHWGTAAHAPLDFQLFNCSGHFRAAQTLLTFDSMQFHTCIAHLAHNAYSTQVNNNSSCKIWLHTKYKN